MIDARTAYDIMSDYISKNPDDYIINMAETSDDYVFGTKDHPSYGNMAVNKETREPYIIHIVDYAKYVDAGDVREIDMRTFERL